jgi:hypothetical protein
MHLSKCEHCEIASGAALASCKTRNFRVNVADFDALDDSTSQKEKKIFGLTLNLSRLFRGTVFASVESALTISSPETQRLSPSQGRAT